ADGGLLANAHTVLTILEPIGRSAIVPADKETKAKEEREAVDATNKAEEARRLAEAKAAEERKAEAARKAAEERKAEAARKAPEAKKGERERQVAKRLSACPG